MAHNPIDGTAKLKAVVREIDRRYLGGLATRMRYRLNAGALSGAMQSAPAAASTAPPRELVRADLNPFLETPTRLRGRDVRAGYQRGWGLEFGGLRELVARDPLYRRAFEFANGYSVVSEPNRMNLFLLLKFFLGDLARGHILEFGSYRGGNAMFLAEVSKSLGLGSKVYALDTFAGMPAVDLERDAHRPGDFSDSGFERLQGLIEKRGLADHLELVRGTFDATAPELLERIGSVRLAYIDCDIYSGVVYGYDVTKPYMVEGGYWVFDDALYSSCIGAMEAVEEVAIQRDGRFAEQAWPHLVYRNLDPKV